MATGEAIDIHTTAIIAIIAACNLSFLNFFSFRQRSGEIAAM